MKTILLISLLLIGLFSAPVAAEEEYTFVHTEINTSYHVNSSSFSVTWGGDWENATVSWNTTVIDDSLLFLVLIPDDSLIPSHYLNTHDPNGTIFLDRDYFLLWQYEPNRGGSAFRGIHLYFRSQKGEDFDITISIDGFRRVVKQIDPSSQDYVVMLSLGGTVLVFAIVFYITTRKKEGVN